MFLLNWSCTLIFILVSAHTMFMSQMWRFSPSSVGFSVVNRKITVWHFPPGAYKWSLCLSFCPAHSFLQRYGQHLPAWLRDSNHFLVHTFTIVESNRIISSNNFASNFHSLRNICLSVWGLFCNHYGYSVTCFSYTPYLSLRSAVFSDVCVVFF